jgi:hypothetical protein
MTIGNEVLPGQTNDPPPVQAAVKNAFGIAIETGANGGANKAAPNTAPDPKVGAENGKASDTTGTKAPEATGTSASAKSASAKSAAEQAAVRALAGVGDEDTTDPNVDENAPEVKIPQAAMRGIKERERQKAQLALAQELGYETVEEMKAAASRRGADTKPKDPLEDPDTPVLFDEDEDEPDDPSTTQSASDTEWVTERKELLSAAPRTGGG